MLSTIQWKNQHYVVILDNASIHHEDGIAELMENQAGVCLLFLPQCSPDFNLLEEVFSQIKSMMKQNDDKCM